MAALRILHALVAPGRGGAESMALALARAQRGAGHHPGFLLLSPGPFAEDAQSARLPVHVAPLRSALDALGARRAARAIEDFAPHVVHCHGTRPLVPVAWARAAANAGAPVVCTRHGDAAWLGRSGLTRAVQDASERWLFASVGAVAGVNEALVRADRARFPRLPVEFVVNGIDVQSFAPARSSDRQAVREAFGLPGSAPLVACTSRLVPIKGVDVLVDAWAIVSSAHPGAHLVLAGDGECRQELDTRVRRLGVADSVHLAGSLRDVARLVSGADLFVSPSVRGCFGRSAIEALASGTPVVASRLDGTDRFVTDGVTARLVPPGQPGALAAAIADLLADDETRLALAHRGRALAESRFSIEAMALAYEALYARAGAHGFPAD